MADAKAQANPKGSRKGRQKNGGNKSAHENNTAWYPDPNLWWAGMPFAPDASWWSGQDYQGEGNATGKVESGSDKGDGTAEVILDALSGDMAQKGAPHAASATKAPTSNARSNQWLMAPGRPLTETMPGFISPEVLLGQWVDSLGNLIMVMSIDAFDVRLVATLSRPPRPDIHLNLKPIMLGAGWQCGHSVLDPTWSSPKQMHWVTGDGRISVWVRPEEHSENDEKKDNAEDSKAESKTKDGSEASTHDPVGDEDAPTSAKTVE
mmetsp:Transcript_30610/g.71528  ORF Transcript_30610/g.71528 Transcript_30610/m.71528 type:complete len:264 (+) Transcript_30610:148-939(+)|eukprot:CAMPEP_0178413270 /NCGR_PEP_ID=MMETSP0689_2-20121128/22442_1 /TAXON_ID=160604 /ORGANISM="Amphidinium massartii, Strain CS-259" /LENGTH=263 /DNA_ID=CAMNT_0020034539 /DNA_START=73 /DNA_END=864 /DNA_ORIENTATION=+